MNNIIKLLGNDVLLEVECRDSSFESFKHKYNEKTGITIIKNDKNVYIEDKWGIEPRIYFNGSEEMVQELRRLGYHVEVGRPYNDKYEYRINNTKLFWLLINSGMRLGKNKRHNSSSE